MWTLGVGIAPSGLPETGRTYEKGLYYILRGGGKREYKIDTILHAHQYWSPPYLIAYQRNPFSIYSPSHLRHSGVNMGLLG